MGEWWQEFFLSGDYTLLEEIPPEQTEKQVAFLESTLSLGVGARILDVPCGIGRHSLALAARGYAVVGLDYTPAFVRRAIESAGDLPVRFVRGDMRRLPFPDSRFDALLNLFTSFGYFENDEADAAVLREFARALVPGGLLLLDTMNRDGLANRFTPQGWTEIPGGYLLEDRRWEARTGRVPTTWTFLRSGETHSYTVNVRAYTCPELERMLHAADLKVLDAWGDWEGSPLDVYSRRLILKARKTT